MTSKKKDKCKPTTNTRVARERALRRLELRAAGEQLHAALQGGDEVRRALAFLVDSQLHLLEDGEPLFELSTDQVKDLNDAADDYAKNRRPTDQPKIKAGHTTGAAATPPNKDSYNPKSKPWSALTQEVDCCWDACLLEIVYGIESTFGANAKASDPAKKGKDGPYGPFQLDKKTAVEAGLTVNATTDDRLDLQKAAEAAAAALSRLARTLTFKKIKKCDCCNPKQAMNSACCDNIRKLILLSYNCGIGVLEEARKRAKDACSYDDVKAQLDAALKQFDPWRDDDDLRAAKVKEGGDYVDKYDVLKKKLCPAY